jgi:hypothetical protein
LEPAWPTVALNARWPVPLLHWQPLFHQQLCQGMSCLTSSIPSLAWAHLPTKIVKWTLHKLQSQSTNQTAIPFSQAGKMRLLLISGTFLSPPRPLTLRKQPVPQLLSCQSQLLLCFLLHHPVPRDCPHHPQWSFCQPCLLQPILIPAKVFLPPAHLG